MLESAKRGFAARAQLVTALDSTNVEDATASAVCLYCDVQAVTSKNKVRGVWAPAQFYFLYHCNVLAGSSTNTHAGITHRFFLQGDPASEGEDGGRLRPEMSFALESLEYGDFSAEELLLVGERRSRTVCCSAPS